MLPNRLDLITQFQNLLFVGFRKIYSYIIFLPYELIFPLGFIILTVTILDSNDTLNYPSGLFLQGLNLKEIS
jgi:hypothetical protein